MAVSSTGACWTTTTAGASSEARAFTNILGVSVEVIVLQQPWV
jgi:hypothetical protein